MCETYPLETHVETLKLLRNLETYIMGKHNKIIDMTFASIVVAILLLVGYPGIAWHPSGGVVKTGLVNQ